MCVCVIYQHYVKVNFRNLLAEASQNFTDPSAWLKKNIKIKCVKTRCNSKTLSTFSA